MIVQTQYAGLTVAQCCPKPVWLISLSDKQTMFEQESCWNSLHSYVFLSFWKSLATFPRNLTQDQSSISSVKIFCLGLFKGPKLQDYLTLVCLNIDLPSGSKLLDSALFVPRSLKALSLEPHLRPVLQPAYSWGWCDWHLKRVFYPGLQPTMLRLSCMSTTPKGNSVCECSGHFMQTSQRTTQSTLPNY